MQLWAAILLIGKNVRGTVISNPFRTNKGACYSYQGYLKHFSTDAQAMYLKIVYKVCVNMNFIGKKVSAANGRTAIVSAKDMMNQIDGLNMKDVVINMLVKVNLRKE